MSMSPCKHFKKSYFDLKWYNEENDRKEVFMEQKRNILAYLGFQVVFR